jgi:nitrate/nitrite-specific signal transduction histidine kinase
MMAGASPPRNAESQRTVHWGLPAIRKRAKRIGSELQFWSEVRVSTDVELTIPARMAYEKPRHAVDSGYFQG